MRCSDFENRLNELLDERRAPSHDPDLNRHAQECSNCANALEIGAHFADLWSSDFGNGVQQRTWLDDESKANPSMTKHSAIGAAASIQKWFGPLVAIAACVLIVVAMRPNVPNASAVADTMIQPSARVVNAPVAHVGNALLGNALPLQLQDAQSPLPLPASSAIESGLIANTSDGALIAQDGPSALGYQPLICQPLISFQLLSKQEWNYPIDEVSIPFAANLQIEPKWIEVVSNGMAPVQSSVVKTINAIKRSLSS